MFGNWELLRLAFLEMSVTTELSIVRRSSPPRSNTSVHGLEGQHKHQVDLTLREKKKKFVMKTKLHQTFYSKKILKNTVFIESEYQEVNKMKYFELASLYDS